MYIAVGNGKISEGARAAIEASNGTIEVSLNPSIVCVRVDGVQIIVPGSKNVCILLPGDEALIFTHARQAEECSLDICV